MTRASESGDQNLHQGWFVPRPFSLLQDLPFAYRWEVTRRHPYYLRYWEAGRRYYDNPASHEERKDEEWLANLILTLVGASDRPMPPGTPVEEVMAGDLVSGWEAGAVFPLAFEGMALGLLVALPSDVQVELGRIFLTAEGSSRRDGENLRAAYLRIKALPVLSQIPDAPIISINLQAPTRAITEAVEKMVRQWKDQRGITERRRRDDKLEEYLRVWDLREGWVNDRYDCTQERSLREIGTELKLSISTVTNQYRSAFRLIFGQDYEASLWARVIGFLKLSQQMNLQTLPRRTLHRPWQPRRPRLVPAAVLQGNNSSEGGEAIIDTTRISDLEVGTAELVMDVQHLLTLGWSNEEIANELELTSHQAELVEYFRQRHVDAL